MTDVQTVTSTKVKVKTPSMWKVMIHNDDYTPMDFVVEILMHVFRKSYEDAVKIMLTVHNSGRGMVGLYTKDVAETKVLQVLQLAQLKGHPLLCTAEEA